MREVKCIITTKKVGNTFNINEEEIVAFVDKLLHYKYLSKKQHKLILIKCNLFNE